MQYYQDLLVRFIIIILIIGALLTIEMERRGWK